MAHAAGVSWAQALAPSEAMLKIISMAAAIQAQVTEDFTPVWEIAASVSFFASQSDVPPDYGRIMIVDVLPNPCAEGYHLDNNTFPMPMLPPLGLCRSN